MASYLKKNRFFGAAVFLAVVGVIAFSRTEVRPRAAAVNTVVAVPWQGSELLFHEVYSGGSIVLQAVARDASGNAATNLASATWDAGDGAGPVAISVAAPLALERTVTYTGSLGTPFTATIRVVDTDGNVYTDTMNVKIASNSRETKVNMAIDKGLWNLHKRGVQTTADGLPAMNWVGVNGFNITATASSVQAFEINNHRQSADPAHDPYAIDVQRGLRFLLGSPTSNSDIRLRKLTTSLQGSNNPDANSNSFGLYVGDGTTTGTENSGSQNGHASYIGGQVIDALVASGTPNEVATTGVATYVNGRRYTDIVQDMLDGYAWGMSDAQGGWGYGFNYGQNDTSASHWWAIGTLASQSWGLDSPQWVKNTQLTVGVPLMQDYTVGGACNHTANGLNGTANNDGHFGYTNNKNWLWDSGTNTTAAGLILLNADGVAQTNGRFTCASQYLDDRYTTSLGNFYTMYQLTKAMRTAVDSTGHTASITLLNGTRDWYAGYADYLVTNQNAAGAFTSGGTAVAGTNDLTSSWAIIILSPSLFDLPPSASCTATPSTLPTAGGLVNFDASASFHPDPNASIVSYTWNFGDSSSTTETDALTSHTYAQPASWPTTRSATVTVTDNRGNSATASCPVTIVNTNVPPTVTTGGPYTMCMGSTLTLNATATDADSTIAATGWDWTSPVNNLAFDATGVTVDATAAFTAMGPGVYNLGFRATDNFNASSDAFTTVTVLAANNPACNQPPTITMPPDQTIEATSPAGAVATFAATAADDHDTITPVCTPASGSVFGILPNTSQTTPVTCTATDSGGLTASGTFNVTVQDTTPPVLSVPAPITIHATSITGAAVNYSATATDIVDVTDPVICSLGSGSMFPLGTTTVDCSATDQHGNKSTASFTVTVTNAAPTAQPANASTHGAPVTVNLSGNWNDPDGDTIIGPTPKIGPFNGTIVVNPDGSVTYTPFNAFHNGNDTWTYSINDGRGGSTDGTLTINVHNVNPVVAPTTASTHGDPVTVTLTGLWSDADGDTLAGPLPKSGPTHGTVTVNADRSVTYTPFNVFNNGTDTWVYSVDDGHGGSVDGTLTVNVHNVAPVAQNDSATTHNAVAINVLANDGDADGDPLSVMVMQGPQHGSAVVNPDKTVTYTPFTNQFNPSDSFTYSVNDGHGGTATATVTITVTNAPPVAVNDNVTLAHNQTSINVPVLINDSDPDGDTLSLNSFQGNGNTHGTLVGNPDGSITYTAAPGFFGPTATFSYSARDKYGATATATVTVTFTNTKPTDTPYSVNTHGQPVTVNVLANAADADGDTVTLQGACGSLPPQHGGCQVNQAAGTVTYTPNGGWYGPTDTFGYLVNDGHGGFAQSVVTVTYVNQLPVPAPHAFTTPVNTQLLLSEADLLAGATDPDGDHLSVPAGVSVTNGTLAQGPVPDSGYYVPTPGFIGVATLSYVVDDNHGGLVPATATITVSAPTTTTVSAPPIVYGADGAITVTVGSAATSTPVGALSLSIAGGPAQTQQLVNGVATFTMPLPAAGDYALSASYTGQDYFLSSVGAGTLHVAKAPTVTVVTCADAVYTGSALETCTANVTGVNLNQAVTPVSYTANTNAGTATASASYAGDANHSGSSDTKAFTIAKRPITITADAKTKIYGNVDPALTYQITSGNLVAADAFTGSLTRVAGEAVGTYAILQGSVALSNNYALTYVSANLTITGAYGNKAGVLAEMRALRLTVTDKHDGEELDDAIARLAASLDPKLWRVPADGVRLNLANGEFNGEKAIELEKQSVEELEELIKSKKSALSDAQLQGWADRIAAMDRLLAVVQIGDAQAAGADPKKIAEALKELQKGDDEGFKDKRHEGIDHYKNAWKQAVEALKK